MDLINSPINDITNEKENLVINSEQNEPQNSNIVQFSIEGKNQSSKDNNRFVAKFTCNYILVCIFSLLLSCPILFGILVTTIVLYIRIIIILIGVLLELMLLFCFNKKIVFLKDASNEKLIIKVINFLCFAKKIIIFDLENIHFNILQNISYSQDGPIPFYGLLIINDFKNLVGIDLDDSNIKQKPAKYLYYFDNYSLLKYQSLELARQLNYFVGSPRNYKNPLCFNINKYLKKKRRYHYGSSSYMKFSDHFFIYHLLGEFNKSRISGCFPLFVAIMNCIFFIIAMFLLAIDNKKIRLILVIFPLVANITFYILYKCLTFTFDNILRIDCIYSKNFDRIFIGLVKYTKTKYVNTFEYQMDNIDRFILENGGNNRNRIFNLKVVFKNNDIQQIFTLRKKTKADLEGLIYLLNERLNINANTNITPNNNFDTNEKNKDKN